MNDMVLIEEGVKFLVLGMTTVYIFLYLMVVILKIESKIVQKYFPSAKKTPPPIKTSQKKVSNDDEIVAAITAAIIEHKKR